MAGVEVDLNYHLRKEFFDPNDPHHLGAYSIHSHGPGMINANNYNSVEGAEVVAGVTASDRSFVSDVEGHGSETTNATSQEKIKSFSSIFRAKERPAVNSYIMTVIQSDHDYSHHWSCNPDNKSSTQQANIVKLFAPSETPKTNCWHNSSLPELDDQEIDVEGDWNDAVPNVPYNEKLARKLMLECERHMEFAGGDAAAVAEKQARAEENGVLSDTEEEEEAAGDDAAAPQKDLNLSKAGWTTQQERAFDRAVAILDGERLARLACTSVQHEPARRRALLDRSASKFRRLLSGECRWDLSLCRWLHNTLLHTLSSSYLISYLDILQSLSYALPSLMDKLLAPSSKSGVGKKMSGGSALNTPNAVLSGVSFSPSVASDVSGANFDFSSSGKFTPAHSSIVDTGDGGVPSSSLTVPSSRQIGVSSGGAVDASPGSVLATLHSDHAGSDAKNNNFGGSISSLGLSLLLKRPWDPAMPILHSNKPQSLGSGSPVVLLVAHCPQLSPASARRHKTFASTLHRVTTTVSITVPHPPGGRLEEWLESTVDAVVTAVQEWRARGRTVVLAGWRAGGLLAAQIAAAHPSVEGVICLSPPFSGAADYTSNANRAEHPASDQSSTDQGACMTTADILSALTCPVLLVVGDRAHNVNLRAVEQLRERLPQSTSQLVVLQGADSELQLHPLQRYRAALTNSLVDRCIVDEIGCFISNVMMKEEATPEVIATGTAPELPNFSTTESTAPTGGADSCATDLATGETLVTAKRKVCDETLVSDSLNGPLHASPKKIRPAETNAGGDDGVLSHGVPAVSMAVIASTVSTLPSCSASSAASGLPTASTAAPTKDATDGVWNKPSSEGSSVSARGSNRRGRRAGRGRGRGSRAPLPGQLIALGGGVGVAAQAHLKNAGRRQSALSGRGGAARGMHSLVGRSPFTSSASPSVSDGDVMLLSPVSPRPKMAPSKPVSIKEQVAQAAQSEAQLLAAVASITPQSPPESQAPSKITTVSTSNVVRSPIPMASVTQAVEFLERSNSQQPQVHYMLHPQQVLTSSSSAPIVVGSIGELSSASKVVSADVTFTTSVLNMTSGSLADKRKSIPSIMSNVGDRRKNMSASAGAAGGNKKPIIFQTSGGGLFSTTNRIILPSTVSSVGPNLSSLIVSSSPCVVPSLAPIKKLIRPSLAHSTQRMTAPVVLSNQKSIPSFVTSPKPSVAFVSSTKADSGQKPGQGTVSDRKTLVSNANPGSTFIANQKGSSTFVTSQRGPTPTPTQKVSVSTQPVPQIIGTLRGGRVSLNSDVMASGVLQGVPTIISGARFISTRGSLKGSMTRGGIVQARTLASSSGRGLGATPRQLITVGGTSSNTDTSLASMLPSSTIASKGGHNILLTTLATSVSKPISVSSPLTTDASTCTSPSPGAVLNLDTGKSITSANKPLPQTPVGVKQLLLELPQSSEKTFKILPQKSQHVLKIADKSLQGHAKILVSSQKASQYCYKPIVVQKKNFVSKLFSQADDIIPLQSTAQCSSGELPKQAIVSTTMSTTGRISSAAESLRASSQINSSLVLVSSAPPLMECSDLTTAITTSFSSGNFSPVTTFSLSIPSNQSLSKNTSSLPIVPENDSPASLTEKLDLLAAAASEISQKMSPDKSIGASDVLLDGGNNTAQSQNSSPSSYVLSTSSNATSLQSSAKDQLIEISLEEVPKLNVAISQSGSDDGIVFKGKDQNPIALQKFSLKTDSFSKSSINKLEAAAATTGKGGRVHSAVKTVTFSSSGPSSEAYNVDKTKHLSTLKSKTSLGATPFDLGTKTSQETSSNYHQKKLSDKKHQLKISKPDSESSSDVEIIEESSLLKIPSPTSKSAYKDKNKITLSKSSCSQIKIFSSSSNVRLPTSSSSASPQIIVSTQSSRSATIVRPGRSLGTIDGKNITKLTVRPTSSFKSITSQPNVAGAKKIIITSGLPVRHQNPSSAAIASSHFIHKESELPPVTASVESPAQPAVMTVGASEAFSCMKVSPNTAGVCKSAVASPESLVSTSTAPENSSKKPISVNLDYIMGNIQEPIESDEAKNYTSLHSSTVQVVSANEAFSSKSNVLNLKKIHIGKSCEVQDSIVLPLLAKDKSVQDSHAGTSSPCTTTSTTIRTEEVILSEILPDSKEMRNSDHSVTIPSSIPSNLDVSTFTSSNVRKISLAAIPTKVSLRDAFASSTVDEPNPINDIPMDSEVPADTSTLKDAFKTNDDDEQDSLKSGNETCSSAEIPQLSLDNVTSCHTLDSKTIPVSSPCFSSGDVFNATCAEEENNCPLGPLNSDTEKQKLDYQVTLVKSDSLTAKPAEGQENDKLEIPFEDNEGEPETTPTSVGSESTEAIPRPPEEENVALVKVSPVPSGSKGPKSSSSRNKNVSGKTQKRHSVRLSLTPYERAAQLRSGKKRSS